MTLSEILGRGVSTEWYEAVALVRGVTARLLDTSSEASLFPELHQIEIGEVGVVNITGKTIDGDPVRHLVLSAAKAWHFQPALKDGHAVRFRKTLWIVSE